jgi:glycosyltransferase involved in cell wall biosynthesis
MSLRQFDVKSLGKLAFHREGKARVGVVVPLYNYAKLVEECLQSVFAQDLPDLALTVIDDASSDDGCDRAIELLQASADRFARVSVVRHTRNQGLSMARNSGIAWSPEPFLFMLDADNRLRRPALSRLLEAINGEAFAYSQLRMFGDQQGVGVADLWEPERLRSGNYIDAMALIRRDALLAVGGYHVLADDHGWEDYDLWCRFAAAGYQGVFLPEPLCEYRVHGASMLRTRTNRHFEALMAEMALRHPALFHPPAKP